MKKTVSDEKRFIAIATVILVVISIVALFPMILLVVASFTDENELITNGYQILPKKLSRWHIRWHEKHSNIEMHYPFLCILPCCLMEDWCHSILCGQHFFTLKIRMQH